MQGCKGNTAFCVYRPAQPLSSSTSSSVFDMGGDQVSDQSWSMLNWHPITYGLSTTGMIFSVVLILVLGWCCIRNGGKKLFKKLRAPHSQPTLLLHIKNPSSLWPPGLGQPHLRPQGLLAYNPTTAASMPSLASTNPTSPPLYDEISRMNQKLDKMSIQDSVIKNNQYRIMNSLEKSENYGE